MPGHQVETQKKTYSSTVSESRKQEKLLNQRDSGIPFESVFSPRVNGISNIHYELLIRSKNSPSQNMSNIISRLQRSYGNSRLRQLVDLSRSGDDDSELSSETESSIQSKRGGGQPLDDNVRTEMESSFGMDFRGVKIHTDPQSDSLNKSLNARAFTTGKDIFFASGEYNPRSSSGKHLLAHELTHVVQQNQDELQTKANEEKSNDGGICDCRNHIRSGKQTKLRVSSPGDKYEQDADRVADLIMNMPRSSAPLQRMCTECEEELRGKAALEIQRVCSKCEAELHRKPVEKKTIQKQDEPVENIDPIEDANPSGSEASGETTPDPDPPNVSIELPSPLTIRVNGVMYTSPTYLVEGPNGSIVDLAPYTGSGIIDFPLAALESLGIPILSYYHFHYGRARQYLGQHFESAYALSGGTSFIRNALHYGYITSDDVTLFGAPGSYNFEHYEGIPHFNIVANPMDIGTMINVSYFNFPLVEGQNNPAVMFSINAPFDQNPFEAFTNLGGAIYHALSGDLYNMPGVTHSYPRFHSEPNAAIGAPTTTTRISPKSDIAAYSITDTPASSVKVNRICSECEEELQEKHGDAIQTAHTQKPEYNRLSEQGHIYERAYKYNIYENTSTIHRDLIANQMISGSILRLQNINRMRNHALTQNSVTANKNLSMSINSNDKLIQRATGVEEVTIGTVLAWCASGAAVTLILDEILQIGRWLIFGSGSFRQNWCSTLASALFGCVFGMAGGAAERMIFDEAMTLGAAGFLRWAQRRLLIAGYTQLAGKIGLAITKAGC